MDRHARTLIIGGALVGPATARLLTRAGFRNVMVAEASPVTNPTSGGVMGLRDETTAILRTAGVITENLPVLNSTLVTAYDRAGDDYARRGASDFPGLTTSWEVLHRELVRDMDVSHRKRVTDVISNGDDQPATVTFADGTAGEYDLIIFADGRKSTGRRLFDPARHAQFGYQGYVTWRGLVDPPTPTPVGFERYNDTPRGTLFSLTEPQLHSGLSYWEYSHNMSREDAQSVLGGSPERRSFLLPHQVGERARDALRAAQERFSLPDRFRDLTERAHEIMLLPVNDLPVPERAVWHVGSTKIVLVGDALIPARLQAGAGLNQGIKQAGALTRYLAAGQPLTQWESEIIPDVAAWIELGRARAARINLGSYLPVRPGFTAVPGGTAWATPQWVAA